MADYKYDSNAKYLKSHEWVRIDNGVAIMGVSDVAQDQLSDVVYVDLPAEGDEFSQGGTIAVVESVKAAEDVFAPLSGKVVAVNEALEESPELVNQDPYGEGWFLKLEPSDLSELDNLMDAEAYAHFVAEEA